MAPPHNKIHKDKKNQNTTQRGHMKHGPGGNYLDTGPQGPAPHTATDDGTNPSAPPPPPTGDELGIPGLPAELAAQLDKIIRSADPNAEDRAYRFLRASDWYKQEYKGIDAGVLKGIIPGGPGNAEAAYRSYRTQIQGLYQQYYGRTPSQDEIASYLTLGYTPEHVGGIAGGAAYVQANQGEIQYAAGAFGQGQLTPAELKAYGEEQSGIDSTLGVQIKARVESALQKAQRVFGGTLGSSALGDAALNNNLQGRNKPDISA